MELMDCSLDKFYKFIYEELNEYIPEAIIGKITLATVKALNYLKVGFPANSNSNSA
jgi:mitogen-activated protein kinase kinase 4